VTVRPCVLRRPAFLPVAVLCSCIGGLGSAAQRAEVETLTAVAALPAHIAGSFQQLTACQQTAGGDYFIFDRRSHAVFVAPAGFESARKLITIGAEPGRLLDPSAFDLAGDDTFIVADAPGGQPRVQVFLDSGSTVSGFRIAGRAVPRITFGNLVLGGLAAVEYTGRSIFLSQPELGALIAEYALDGRPLRTFGDLRKTGHEQDPGVHLALNSGVVIANPAGGFFFVFLAGVPQFRKYDPSGRLLFDRHIEGPELDALVQALPTTWARRKVENGELPIVMPSVQAAAADAAGNLWIATAAGITYVYDPNGEKKRAVRFRGAGPISPTAMSFTPKGRLLVTPGCYAFDAGRTRPGPVTPAR
jgi:hypothetical protein